MNGDRIAQSKVRSVWERAPSLGSGLASLGRRLRRASAWRVQTTVDMPACCQGQSRRGPTSEILTGERTAMHQGGARLRWVCGPHLSGLTTRSSGRVRPYAQARVRRAHHIAPATRLIARQPAAQRER